MFNCSIFPYDVPFSSCLILQHLAQHLQRLSRSTDLVARFAGDEFVLILPQTDRDEATVLMARMMDEVRQIPVTYEGTTLLVSLCYGIASLPDSEVVSSQQFLQQADQQLYDEKRRRKA